MPHRLKAQLITQRGHTTTEFRPVAVEFTLTPEQKRLVFYIQDTLLTSFS